ncbi:small polypeptide DEVIL 15-like [Bidens hawaiensis]|uniref:small polypeptide DEVIL 15 n=1 Tax=Bidens hawaiensis TaxID=980011 RepID=UPI00404B392F
MDKKWKLSKEDPCTHSSKSSSSFLRSMSHKSSTKSPLLRSFSQKSSSQKNITKSPCELTRSSSLKCSNFTRKCGHLAKEQKARFYIVKRCVTMLVCWKKHGDS